MGDGMGTRKFSLLVEGVRGFTFYSGAKTQKPVQGSMGSIPLISPLLLKLSECA